MHVRDRILEAWSSTRAIVRRVLPFVVVGIGIVAGGILAVGYVFSLLFA